MESSSPPLIKYVIMGVPARRKYISNMLSLLPSTTDVQLDLHPDGTIWKNAKLAWGRATNCSHILVLQDDLGLPPNFPSLVSKIVALLPNDIISFYSPRYIKEYKDCHWVKSNVVTGQALLMPSQMVSNWLAWVSEHCLAQQRKNLSDGDDIRLCAWMHVTDTPVFYTSPSVVQHLGAKSTVFAMTMRNKNSASYPTDDPESLSNIDWSVGILSPRKHTYSYKVNEFKSIIKPEYLGLFRA